MINNSNKWPVVLVDNPGMRPVGKPDECFYCRRRIGQPHGDECVIVVKKVKYLVRVGGKDWDDLDGEVVGSFTRDDPYHWTVHDCKFHKNGSSWCAGNAEEYIEWLDTPKSREIQSRLESQEEDGCTCSILAFSFKEEVDPGPYYAGK